MNSVARLMVVIASCPLATPAQQAEAQRLAIGIGGAVARLSIWIRRGDV